MLKKLIAKLTPPQKRDAVSIAKSSLVILTVGFWWWYLQSWSFYAFSITLSFLLFTVVMAGLSVPLFIDKLVNNPEGMNRSGFHLFTYMSEGVIKVLIRGGDKDKGRFIRAMMLDTHLRFARVNALESPSYWEGIEVPESEKGTYDNIFPDMAWYLRPWARYVYRVTGAAFTGFYPFQRSREYELPINKSEQDGDGKYTVTVRNSISDHYRSREFVAIIHVPKADTNDGYELEGIFELPMRVRNVHLAANSTENFYTRGANMAVSEIRRLLGRYSLSQAISEIENDDDDTKPTLGTDVATALIEAIKTIGPALANIGILIGDPGILDVSPRNLSSEKWDELRLVANARRIARASRIETEQAAANIKTIADANKYAAIAEGDGRAAAARAGGEVLDKVPGAVRAAELQANVDMTRAAGDKSTVFLTVGGPRPETVIPINPRSEQKDTTP